MSDERKWCWLTSDHSEEAFGPFDTREQAIADAKAEGQAYGLEAGDTVVLGRCDYADPADAAERWAETFDPLEDLNENTDETLQDYENGETYTYSAGASDGKRAERELSEMIVDWAKRNVKTRYFCANVDNAETVML